MSERPIIFSGPMVRALLAGRKTMTRRLATSPLRKCEPGDRLWVREAWKPHSMYAHMKPREMPESEVFYSADGAYAPSNTRWIPSIHMPRWASRITLTVTVVKVERLQEINEEDAIAEGVEPAIAGQDERGPLKTCRTGFVRIWNELHGAASWLANPEVLAIRFTLDGRAMTLPTLALAAVLASAAASAAAQPAQPDICVPGYAREHRMPAAEAHAIKLEMMRREHPGEPLSAYTLDHRTPLCLGGANDEGNLQLQPVDEAKRKDADEVRLCRAVCAGWMSLDDAQRQMREWRP